MKKRGEAIAAKDKTEVTAKVLSFIVPHQSRTMRKTNLLDDFSVALAENLVFLRSGDHRNG